MNSIELQGDEATGLQILQSALVLPFLTVVFNSGQEPSLALNRLAKAGQDATIDLFTGEMVSAEESGIMDAAGTLEAVLRWAVSVASSLLTVDVAIADPPTSDPRGQRLDMSAKYEKLLPPTPGLLPEIS